jgi:hypothetical protein
MGTSRDVSFTDRSRFFARMRTWPPAKSRSSTLERHISLRRAPVWATHTNME